MGGSRGGTECPDPGKSQMAIGFLRITGMGSPGEAIGSLWSNCFSREVGKALTPWLQSLLREVRMALCEIC